MELAIYAAIVGTASLGIHVFRLYRERPRLKVLVHPVWEDGSYARGGARFTHLFFEVLNTGRAPVVLTRVGSEARRHHVLSQGASGALSSGLLNDERLPAQLDPGHRYLGIAPLPASVLSKELAIHEIWAEDSLGRRYRPSPHRLGVVRAEVEASLAHCAA